MFEFCYFTFNTDLVFKELLYNLGIIKKMLFLKIVTKGNIKIIKIAWGLSAIDFFKLE